MEIIMISNTKLKVMLSAEDMEKYSFDPEDCADISSRSAFRNILHEARERCGFDAVGDRVFVQYYPSKSGGGEMFVTKLSEKSEPTEHVYTEKMKNEDNRQRGITDISDKSRKYRTEYIVYTFDCMKEVLLSCSALKRENYVGASMVYAANGNGERAGAGRYSGYFLVLDRDSYIPGEYGGSKCDCRYYHVLTEHGTLVCSDAAQILGDLA